MRARGSVNMPRHLQYRRLTWKSAIYGVFWAALIALWITAGVMVIK